MPSPITKSLWGIVRHVLLRPHLFCHEGPATVGAHHERRVHIVDAPGVLEAHAHGPASVEADGAHSRAVPELDPRRHGGLGEEAIEAAARASSRQPVGERDVRP